MPCLTLTEKFKLQQLRHPAGKRSGPFWNTHVFCLLPHLWNNNRIQTSIEKNKDSAFIATSQAMPVTL